MDPALDHHRIAAALEGNVLGREVIYFAEVASTNDEVHRLAQEGRAEGVTVFADHQSAGRGRRGAKWSSRPRRDLLFSVLLRPHGSIENWTRLAHIAALAVADAVDIVADGRSQLKWPNDVFLDGRKIAGLLLESRADAAQNRYAVLGIGLNVNSTARDWPATLRPLVTSLRLARRGPRPCRESVAISLFESLNRRYRNWEEEFPATLHEIRSRSFLFGRRVCARIGEREWIGLACDYAEDGGLVLALDNGSFHTVRTADSIRVA